jgi:hypothetical protein
MIAWRWKEAPDEARVFAIAVVAILAFVRPFQRGDLTGS